MSPVSVWRNRVRYADQQPSRNSSGAHRAGTVRQRAARVPDSEDFPFLFSRSSDVIEGATHTDRDHVVSAAGEDVLERSLTRERSYCRFCGAELVDGQCSASCSSGSRPPAAPGAAPVRPQSPPGFAAGDVAEHRVPRRSVLTVVGVSSGVAALVAAGVSYANLDHRLDRLDVALSETSQAQTSAGLEMQDLQSDQNKLADQLASTQNKLDEHPAASKVAKEAQPSVFTVLAGGWLGSGFVVGSNASDSKLLTNYHVVEAVYADGGRHVKIRRGDTTIDGRIVDVSQADDLALIEVNQVLPALELATKRAAVGDPLLVLGSPNGLAGTLTSGIVSSYRTLAHVSYLQFSAPISPGNSGGPVLDERGHVLGVTVMKDVSDESEGIGYAIPTDRVCESLDLC